LGSLLLRSGVRVELKGLRAGDPRLIYYLILSLLRGHRAVGISGGFKSTLLLELRRMACGSFEHAGDRYFVCCSAQDVGRNESAFNGRLERRYSGKIS